MMNDEKKCPLTKMTCYGKECAWWHLTNCAVISLVSKLHVIGMEQFQIRNELYLIRKDNE